MLFKCILQHPALSEQNSGRKQFFALVNCMQLNGLRFSTQLSPQLVEFQNQEAEQILNCFKLKNLTKMLKFLCQENVSVC
jgi:hypothetical protein